MQAEAASTHAVPHAQQPPAQSPEPRPAQAAQPASRSSPRVMERRTAALMAA
jgi:hypothetical protein